MKPSVTRAVDEILAVFIGIIAAKNTEIVAGDIQEGDQIIVGENNLKDAGLDSMRMGGGRRRR